LHLPRFIKNNFTCFQEIFLPISFIFSFCYRVIINWHKDCTR